MRDIKLFILFAALLHLPVFWFAKLQPVNLSAKKNKITKVQTIELRPPPVAIAEPSKPIPKPAPKPKPAPEKPKPKPVAKTKPKPKPKSENKPKLSDTQKKKLEKLLSSKSTPVISNAPIEKLQFSSSESYGKTLTEELKKRLILPEFGSVKVALTIDANGNISDLKIIGSESERNKKFILNKLKGARLPKPPKGRDPQTFIVTLIGG